MRRDVSSLSVVLFHLCLHSEKDQQFSLLVLRLSTKALGSKKASHVVVAKLCQNPHDRLGRSGFSKVLRLELHLFLWIAPEVRRDVGTLTVVLFPLCI